MNHTEKSKKVNKQRINGISPKNVDTIELLDPCS